MLNFWPVALALAALFAALTAWIWRRTRRTAILVAAYGDVDENRILIDLIDLFRKAHPGIKVSLVRYHFQYFSREILVECRKGTGPDVVLMDSVHYSELVFEDLLEPLNSHFLGGQLNINDFYPQVVDRFFLDGFLYAMPRDVAPICMVYYNRMAFDEAGLPPPSDDWDWEKFVETTKKVQKTDASGRVTRWGFIEGWAMLEAWVYDAGGSFVDDIKHPTRWTLATDKNSLRGLQFRYDLIHVHKVMPPPSIWDGHNDSDSAEMFAQGKAAMYLFGLWKTPRFRKIQGFSWDAALLPRDSLGHLDFTLTGSAYGIPKTSIHKKAAWKFVQFASGLEGAKFLAMDGLCQPALEKIAKSPDFLDDQAPRNKKLLLNAMKHGKYAPLCKNWYEVKVLIEEGLRPAWEGKITVSEALERLKPVLENNPPITH